MDIKEIISQKLEMPRDVVMDIPKITILGDMEVYVENYTALLEYNKRCIKLKYKKGIVEIRGDDLKIPAIGEGDIGVFGKISGVKLI